MQTTVIGCVATLTAGMVQTTVIGCVATLTAGMEQTTVIGCVTGGGEWTPDSK